MSNFSVLLKVIQPYIFRKKVDKIPKQMINDVEFLKNIVEISRTTAYVASAAEVVEFGKHVNGTTDITVFVSEEDGYPEGLYDICQNVILTKTDKITLFGLLNQQIKIYQKWDTDLLKAFYEIKDMKRFLTVAANTVHATILLLNEQYDILFSHIMLNDKESLLYKTLKVCTLPNSLITYLSQAQENYFCLAAKEKNYHYEVAPFFERKEKYFLIFVTESETEGPDIQSFSYYLIPYLQKQLCHSMGTNLQSNQSFWDLVDDIVKERMKNPYDIRKALLQMGFPDDESVKLWWIILQHEDQERLQNIGRRVIEYIDHILPGARGTIYDNSIVVLYANDDYIIDNRQINLLNKLAKEYGFRGCISYPMSTPRGLKVCYGLLKRALSLAKQIDKKEKEECLSYFEKYSIYVMTDFCAEAFVKKNDAQSFKYFIHPVIYILMDYDVKNNTDLTGFLYYYLFCGQNLVKTSEMLYVHKNTVINRLKKIKELIDVDMNDPDIQLNLMFSYLVSRYYSYYLSDDIKIKELGKKY